MGFLKFLKREKKGDFDELDLPPAPPSLEDQDFAHGLDEGMELPEIPEFPEEKISAPEPKFGFENEMPSGLPPEPEMEDLKPIGGAAPIPPISMPSAPEPVQPNEVPAREEPRFTPLDAYPKMEKGLFAQERKLLHQRPDAKTVYVKIGKFKAALGSINVVRSDLRKSEEALMKLESIKNSKDRAFDKARNSLDDLQKKLIFIDKTLFKED